MIAVGTPPTATDEPLRRFTPLADAVSRCAEQGHVAPQISLAARCVEVGEGAVELEDQVFQLHDAGNEIGGIHVTAPVRIRRR